MADVLFLLITVAFFAIAAAFVRVCDRIIGPDADVGDLTEGGQPEATETGPLEADVTATAGAGR